MDFKEKDRQPVDDRNFYSDISGQSRTSTYPNRLSRDRCLLLVRFLVFLAMGATMFQLAMFVGYYYSQSNPLIVPALFAFSALLLIGALIDFRSILKLRSEAKRL
jgi:uncharacterized integral membrane protein